MTFGKTLIGLLGAAALMAVASACDSSSDTAPSDGTAPSTNTITITSMGVSPKNITVARGTQVTFVNSDSRTHEMNSNPHPSHEDCPEINQVGFLSAGQSKLTGNLNTARTCGYHDHNRDSDTSLQGTITIQ